METLAEVIVEMRSLGMTQEEIAAAIELSQGYISDVERGKRGGRTPADTLLRAIAKRDELIAKQSADTDHTRRIGDEKVGT